MTPTTLQHDFEEAFFNAPLSPAAPDEIAAYKKRLLTFIEQKCTEAYKKGFEDGREHGYEVGTTEASYGDSPTA